MNSSNLAKPDSNSTLIQEQSNEHNLSHEILISLPHVIAKINEDKPAAAVSPVTSSLSSSDRKALKKQLKRHSLPKLVTKNKQGILKTSRASLKMKMRKSNLSEPKKLLLIKNLNLVAAARNNEAHVKRRSLPIIKQSDKKPTPTPTEKTTSQTTTTPATKIVEPIEPQPIKDEKPSNQDEDDLPLSKLIEIMRTEIKDEPKKEDIKGPMTSEEATTKAANNRPSTTIDELMHKLNNTPTTSILKRKLLSQVGEVPASPKSLLSISFSTEIAEVRTTYLYL